ncbi:hypothetical protein HaLaN_20996 [Haematococcus lacustris]|jgi:hypothetical protein
MTSA